MKNESAPLVSRPILVNGIEAGREAESTLEFRNRLLGIMERKVHWAGPAFAGTVLKEDTGYHFESEARTFVGPFTRYLAGAFAQCPIPEVQNALLENIEEEHWGKGARKILLELKEKGAIAEVPENTGHFELFKLIPEGMGLNPAGYGERPLGPGAEAFRDFLFDATGKQGWETAVAVATIFLEGSRHEWETFASDFPGRIPHKTAEDMNDHPLHTGYDVESKYLLLPTVHHEFDSANGLHRISAWNMVLEHISPSKRADVVAAMEQALGLWQQWRDEVAEQCGVEKGPDGKPRLIEGLI